MPTIQEIKLISKDVVLKYTPINSAVADAVVDTAIYLAQDKYLCEFIGSELVKKLKNTPSPSGKYLVLMEEYIPKCLAWWAVYEMYPHLYVKHDNGSLYIRSSEDGDAISSEQMNSLRSNAKSNASSYSKALIDYVIANISDFPEYSTSHWPGKTPVRAPYKLPFTFTLSNSATSREFRTEYPFGYWSDRFGFPMNNWNP